MSYSKQKISSKTIIGKLSIPRLELTPDILYDNQAEDEQHYNYSIVTNFSISRSNVEIREDTLSFRGVTIKGLYQIKEWKVVLEQFENYINEENKVIEELQKKEVERQQALTAERERKYPNK